jgi:uncharacterized SAM-binding protein YcdF (DUF218 family)
MILMICGHFLLWFTKRQKSGKILVSLGRTVAPFRKRGMNPIPAPAAHLARMQAEMIPGDFYPSALGLQMTQIAVHEYLGIIWPKFIGWI